MKPLKTFLVLCVSILATGCSTVADHRKAVADATENKLTLGVAQRSIQVGMSQADVVTALGSPNMVTRDRSGVETWIYDKFSTDRAYSTSTGGVAGLVIGSGGAGVGGGASASGASSSVQRTLTIIIKFENSIVRDFSYNSTAF